MVAQFFLSLQGERSLPKEETPAPSDSIPQNPEEAMAQFHSIQFYAGTTVSEPASSVKLSCCRNNRVLRYQVRARLKTTAKNSSRSTWPWEAALIPTPIRQILSTDESEWRPGAAYGQAGLRVLRRGAS
jgi:hypothetical protein